MNNKIFLYDGTFIHLLNLCDYLIKNKIRPFNIKDYNYNKSLLDEVINLKINNNEKIIDNIKKNLGSFILKILYYVYLSSEENKELIIYYFYLNSLKIGPKVIYYRNLKCVSEALRIEKYVGGEAHKLKGFLRFKELENKILYAEYKSENCIIEILSYHFQNRLKNEYFIIHDLNMKIISVYDKKRIYFVNAENLQIDKLLSKEESEFSEMWKTFYNTIGIRERKNDICRMNFMPKKYWQYIIEMEDKL